MQGEPAADATDADLLGRIAARDARALAMLYRRYAPRLVALATKKIERSAAEEVLQDVFLAVGQQAESFDATKGAARPWLAEITRRRISNRRRDDGRRARVAIDASLASAAETMPPADQVSFHAHRRALLHDAIRALPEA